MVNVINHVWNYICENGEQYLDCVIITNSSKVFTNKCFVAISKLLKDIPAVTIDNEEQLTVFMPEHSYRDVYRDLGGFILSKNLESPRSMDLHTQARIETYQDETSDYDWDQTNTVADVKHRNYKRLNQPQPRVNQCETCGKIFKESKSLRLHRFQVHTENSYACNICSKVFKTSSILGRG